MRFSRPRLTVRRLMIMVALLGASLGAWIEGRRLHRLHLVYGDRANALLGRILPPYEKGLRKSQEQWLADLRATKKSRNTRRGSGGWDSDAWPPPPEVCRIMADHYRPLEAKYRRAARYPWLPVEPDPPPPNPSWAEPE